MTIPGSKVIVALLSFTTIFPLACYGQHKSAAMMMEDLKQGTLSTAQNLTGNTHGVVGIFWERGDRYPIITAVAEGSAAAKAQIRKGDRLISINDRCTSFLCERQIMWLLRGPIAESVKLTFQRPSGDLLTVEVPRCDPAKLPNSRDRETLLYEVRPEEADAASKYPQPKFNAVSEAPWCLASDGGALVEFYDSKSGISKLPPTLQSSHPQIPGRPPIIDTPPLFTRLSLEDSAVREFASGFGIAQAPAYLFVAPIVGGGEIGGPGIEKNPKSNAVHLRTAFLPGNDGNELSGRAAPPAID
jgi:membrane-associated protease RseP (regulator of RpoE activity)